MILFRRHRGRHTAGRRAAGIDHVGVTIDSPPLAQIMPPADDEPPHTGGDPLTDDLAGLLAGIRHVRARTARRMYRRGERMIVAAAPPAYAATDVALACLEAALVEVLGDVAARLDTQPSGEPLPPLPPIDPEQDTLELTALPWLVGRVDDVRTVLR